jgi:fibronectin-binding autotransporter adhesin
VIASGNSSSLAGLSGAVIFNGGTFHVTADTVSANVANKYATAFAGATSAATATFDIDTGVTLTVGTAGGSASIRTNAGGTTHGGAFTKTGGGTLRILSNNGQLDDPFKLNQGTVIVESATGLGGADNSSNHIDMKSGTTLVLRQNAGTNFLTPISVVDAGATVNVVLERQTAGAGVTHSVNALSSSGAFTINFSAGANVTSGIAALSIGSATFGGNVTVNVSNSNANVTVPSVIAGGFGLTKQGVGQLTLSSSNTFAAVTVTGGVLQLGAGGGRVLTASSLSVAGAKVDLADNAIVINYPAASPIGSKSGSLYTGVTGMIQSGRSGGTWSGSGIMTSRPHAVTGLTSIGIAEAADVVDFASAATALWNGVTVDQTSVLIRYTYSGDASVDGIINGDDFFEIDSGFASQASGFSNGDFDYNCRIDADDYWLIDSNYNKAVNVAPGAPALAVGTELPTGWMPSVRGEDELLAEIR